MEEWRVENLKGAITLAAQTIKSLEIVNGGAAIAILTFYGNLVSSSDTDVPIDKPSIVVALTVFGGGVLFATLCSIFAYLSQRFAAVQHRGELLCFYIAVSMGLLSGLCFLAGTVAAAASFV